MITLEQAERAEAWHLKNRQSVNLILLPAMKDGTASIPSEADAPERWSGAEWNWYIFELVIQ